MLNSIFRTLAATVLIGVGMIVIWFGVTVGQGGWLLKDKAVKIRQDSEYVLDFTSRADWRNYEISLEVRNIQHKNRKKILCYLGINSHLDFPCEEKNSLIDFEWTIFQDGKKIISGREFGNWGAGEVKTDDDDILNNYVSRKIGEFRAKKDSKYKLIISSNIDGFEIDDNNPIIQIHAPIFEYFLFRRISSISIWIGSFVIFLGIVVIFSKRIANLFSS